MGKLTKKETGILSLVLTSWGLILIGSGYTMNGMVKPTENPNNNLEVIHKRVAEIKSNEIKLKDMKLEVNQPLSVNVRHYLENIDNIDQEVLKLLREHEALLREMSKVLIEKEVMNLKDFEEVVARVEVKSE